MIGDKEVTCDIPIIKNEAPKPKLKSMFFDGHFLNTLLLVIKTPAHLFKQTICPPAKNSLNPENFNGEKVG